VSRANAADTATDAATDAAGLFDPANFDADKLKGVIDASTLDDATKTTLKSAVDAAKASPDLVQSTPRAAVAAGCDALFLEVHPDPDRALSDGPNSLRLDDLEALLRTCLRIRRALASD